MAGRAAAWLCNRRAGLSAEAFPIWTHRQAGRVDERNQRKQREEVRLRESTVQSLQSDIKQIRADYTPRAEHRKDLDECRGDIKQIKADYITKEDFFREQAKTDRKLDRIMDILLEMKGDKKSE